MCSGSKFYSLSEEILTAITEDVIRVNSWSDRFPALKVLRLVSLRFAYLKRIQKVLFATIRIRPTPTHLKSFENVDISLFGPYVKEIDFVAPLRSWTLEYDLFEDTVVHYNEHADGACPFSKEQIKTGFRIYRTEAEAINTVLHSDALRVAWIRALQRLRRVRTFRFSSPDWEENRGKHLPVQPNGNWDWASKPYGRALAVVGDAVLAVAIACLSEAGAEVEELEIACHMTTSSRWEDLPGWKSLNLTRMRKLNFQLMIEVGCDNGNPCILPLESQYAREANEAVASLLKKSASCLEHFRYEGQMIWPGEEIVSLPRLLHLELSNGMIEPNSLKTWMASAMPSLQIFELFAIGVMGAYCEFLKVFDAIRDHPNSLDVWFSELHICDWTELSLGHHTDDYEKYLEMEGADTWPEDGNRSLALYLSGKCGYNRALRDMLQDSDLEDEDGDEDEDEGEDAEDEYAEDEDAEDRDAKDEDAEEYGDLANKDAEDQNIENV